MKRGRRLTQGWSGIIADEDEEYQADRVCTELSISDHPPRQFREARSRAGVERADARRAGADSARVTRVMQRDNAYFLFSKRSKHRA